MNTLPKILPQNLSCFFDLMSGLITSVIFFRNIFVLIFESVFKILTPKKGEERKIRKYKIKFGDGVDVPHI